MWYMNLAYSGPKVLREATETERKWYIKTAHELSEYKANIARFSRVDTNYKILIELLATPTQRSIKNNIETIRNAVANFLYSFNECLDHWRVYISRKYGQQSGYFKKYESLRRAAFDHHDEYKITYALRNYQHIDDAVHGCNLRMDKNTFIYASRDVLLKETDTFKNDTYLALQRQPDHLDLFAIFTVAKKALEALNVSLLFYPLTPEIKQDALDALKLQRELCPDGGQLIIGEFVTAEGKTIDPADLPAYVQRGEPMGLDWENDIPFGICSLIEIYKETDFKKC